MFYQTSSCPSHQQKYFVGVTSTLSWLFLMVSNPSHVPTPWSKIFLLSPINFDQTVPTSINVSWSFPNLVTHATALVFLKLIKFRELETINCLPSPPLHQNRSPSFRQTKSASQNFTTDLSKSTTPTLLTLRPKNDSHHFLSPRPPTPLPQKTSLDRFMSSTQTPTSISMPFSPTTRSFALLPSHSTTPSPLHTTPHTNQTPPLPTPP